MSSRIVAPLPAGDKRDEWSLDPALSARSDECGRRAHGEPSPMHSDHVFGPGERIGRYEIVRALGGGGSRHLFVAKDTDAPGGGQSVALEILLDAPRDGEA